MSQMLCEALYGAWVAPVFLIVVQSACGGVHMLTRSDSQLWFFQECSSLLLSRVHVSFMVKGLGCIYTIYVLFTVDSLLMTYWVPLFQPMCRDGDKQRSKAIP